MASAAENDVIEGIALYPKDGHDFQPLATGENVGAYAQVTATIISPSYEFDLNDVIQFTLNNGGLFEPSGLSTQSVPVEESDSWPGVYGVFAHAPKFQSTNAKNVVLHAQLVRVPNTGPVVQGSRDFTFIDPLPIATKSRLGSVKGGGNVTIDDDGTLRVAAGGSDYVLPVAKKDTLGGVKEGKYVTIKDGGKLSVDPGALTPHLNPADIDSYGVVQLASFDEVSVGDSTVKKAVTPSDIKDLYAPLIDPSFKGAVTVDKDQTASDASIAHQELVTSGWVRSQLPNIYRCTSEYLREDSTNPYYAFSANNSDSILVLKHDAPKTSNSRICICIDMHVGDCISVVNPSSIDVAVFIGPPPQDRTEDFLVLSNTKAGCVLVAKDEVVSFTVA